MRIPEPEFVPATQGIHHELAIKISERTVFEIMASGLPKVQLFEAPGRVLIPLTTEEPDGPRVRLGIAPLIQQQG
jgi:hypothetical protein